MNSLYTVVSGQIKGHLTWLFYMSYLL